LSLLAFNSLAILTSGLEDAKLQHFDFRFGISEADEKKEMDDSNSFSDDDDVVDDHRKSNNLIFKSGSLSLVTDCTQ